MSNVKEVYSHFFNINIDKTENTETVVRKEVYTSFFTINKEIEEETPPPQPQPPEPPKPEPEPEPQPPQPPQPEPEPPQQNNPPTVSKLKVINTTIIGNYEIGFTVNDADNDKMDVFLKIDNEEYTKIFSDMANGDYTYRGRNLSAGKHTCSLKVTDGKDTVYSETLNIIIPAGVSDNIFESIELITDGTFKANEYKRVAIRLKAKSDISGKKINIKIDTPNCTVKNVQWEKGSVVSDWKNSTSEINRKLASISVKADAIESQVSSIEKNYVTSSSITQLNNSWTAKFNEGYKQGVTTIDKNGVTVTASNVKSKTSMSANGFKITKTDTNEDIFKVNSNGTLSLKGNITVTGGSVPTSNLTGTISANQLASNSVTADKLHANAINGKTITGTNLRGGTFYTAPNSNETEGYAFRIYSDGRVYSKNIIQVYGQAGNNQYAQLKDGVVTATDYMQTSGFKTSNSIMRWGINDVNVANPSGDNANRLEFTTIDGNKYFRPCYNGVVRNGSSSYPWYSVYSKNGVSTTSDRNLKENIRYIDREKTNTVSSDAMYNFIKDDYVLAQYSYIGDTEEKISAIAQDLLVNMDGSDNIVGQMLVNNEEVLNDVNNGEKGVLSINQTQLLNVTIGALQKAMNKIETLEKEIENLKREVV